MSSYDVEHNIQPEAPRKPTRPDMSSFFSALSQIAAGRNNRHAEPTPAHIETVRALYGASLRARLDELVRDDDDDDDDAARARTARTLTHMMGEMAGLPAAPAGAPQAFVDALERVPRAQLRPGMACPICGLEFVEDAYPLVVRLPCHGAHVFDLECVGPWLLMKATCPLDRTVLLARPEVVPAAAPEEEEEEEVDCDEDCL